MSQQCARNEASIRECARISWRVLSKCFMEEIVASTDILTYKLSFVDVLHVTIIAEHEQVPWHQTAAYVGLCDPCGCSPSVLVRSANNAGATYQIDTASFRTPFVHFRQRLNR